MEQTRRAQTRSLSWETRSVRLHGVRCSTASSGETDMAKPRKDAQHAVGTVVGIPADMEGIIVTVKWSQRPRSWWYEVLATNGLTYVVNERGLKVA